MAEAPPEPELSVTTDYVDVAEEQQSKKLLLERSRCVGTQACVTMNVDHTEDPSNITSSEDTAVVQEMWGQSVQINVDSHSKCSSDGGTGIHIEVLAFNRHPK